MATSRIPTEPLLPVLRRYLDEYETEAMVPGAQEYSSTLILAERAGMEYDVLWHTLAGRAKTIDFDVADRLMCAMGLVHLWWREPLKTIYENVDLSGKSTCMARECGREFDLPEQVRGGNEPLYCSSRCQNREHKLRAKDRQREAVAA